MQTFIKIIVAGSIEKMVRQYGAIQAGLRVLRTILDPSFGGL